jgi:hypothetical protein
MSEPSHDDFRERIEGMARGVGGTFTEPDDDWMAVGFAMNIPEKQVTVIELPPEMFDVEGLKHQVMDSLAAQVKEQKWDAVAFLASSWRVQVDGDDPRPEPGKFEEHPDVQEAVTIWVVSKEKVTSSTALIYRDEEQPPGLGDFDVFEADNGTVGGGMIAPFLEAYGWEVDDGPE